MHDPDHPAARTERQYSVDRLTIVPLDQPVPVPAPLQKFSWPIELQGKGASSAAGGSFEVRYPKGDVLLSFVTTIHELGHLRQDELNPAIATLPPESHERLYAEERGAWDRGWERVVQACPDIVAALEAKVTTARAAGKLVEGASFRALYEWVRDHVLTMVEAQRVLFEGVGDPFNTQRWEELAATFERQDLQTFLEHYAAMRTGELVAVEDIEGMIRRVVTVVASE